MEDQPSSSQEAADKNRRKRGKPARNVGPKPKTHRDARRVQQEVPSTEEESSLVSDSVSGSECAAASEDSDRFSKTTENTSDVTEATASEETKSVDDPKPKRRKKASLDYRKGSSKTKVTPKDQAGCSKDTDESLNTTTTTAAESDNDELDVGIQENLFVSGENDTPGSTKESLNETAKVLTNNLTPLIPSGWSADIVQNSIVRIFNLNASENAAVQRTIYWNCGNGNWGIYVHGGPVRSMKFLVLLNRSDKTNIGAVADFLFKVLESIQMLVTCHGVTGFKGFWKTGSGHIENVSAPCYRSNDCQLLINTGIGVCANCRRDAAKFERQENRGEKGHADPHIPDENLSFDELKKKKDEYKSLYDKEKEKADRLQNKVEELKIKLDEALSDELTAILFKNQDKMTPLHKVFWKSQREAFATEDKRGLRWHPMVIRLALHLHCISSAGYEYLQPFSTFTIL